MYWLVRTYTVTRVPRSECASTSRQHTDTLTRTRVASMHKWNASLCACIECITMYCLALTSESFINMLPLRLLYVSFIYLYGFVHTILLKHSYGLNDMKLIKIQVNQNMVYTPYNVDITLIGFPCYEIDIIFPLKGNCQ